MKKYIMSLILVVLMFGVGWAECPNQQPFCSKVNGDINQTGDFTTSGTLTITGGSLQTSSTYIDIQAPTNGLPAMCITKGTTATGTSYNCASMTHGSNVAMRMTASSDTSHDSMSPLYINMERNYNQDAAIVSCDAPDDTVTILNHGFADGDIVRVSANECNDSLVAGTIYYVCNGSEGTNGVKFTTTYADAVDDCSEKINILIDSTVTANLLGGSTTSAFNTAGTFRHIWSDSDYYPSAASTLVASAGRFDLQIDDGNTGSHIIPYYSNVWITANSVAGNNGTITDYRAIDIKDFTGSGATVTSNAGLYVGALTYGTNNYGIVLADGADCVWMDGTGGTALCSETTTISSAQIQALAATPIAIATAHSGAWLEPVSVVLILDFGTVAYDDAAADGNLIIQYATSNTAIAAAIEADGFIDSAADIGRYLGGATNFTYPAITDDITSVDGEGLEIINDGAEFTVVGGGDGVMDVKVTYYLHVMGL